MAELDENNFSSNEVDEKSAISLSRAPVRCAITGCNESVSATGVLTHYVTNHSNNMAIQCREIQPNKSLICTFNSSDLEWRKNTCLGILVYGDKNREYCPAERRLCLHNTFLPRGYERFDAHLPILIMACRTSWLSFSCNEEHENEISNESNKAEEIVIIWFISVDVAKPIHCIATLFDKSLTKSQSAIVGIRNFKESQNPSEFVSEDVNYIRLTHNDIKKFSDNFNVNLNLDILIKEYEEE